MTPPGTRLTVHVFSFGFKFSGPPPDESGHGGGFVFDCRALPNPFWDEALRPYSGREAPVAAFMERHAEVAAYAGHAWSLVRYTAAVYRGLGRERLMVSFGCTGGRHRSVYMAELIAARLREEDIDVALVHRDMERPGAGEPL
jgi:RNase adaptor protein for sRNA GlmZ degradation